MNDPIKEWCGRLEWFMLISIFESYVEDSWCCWQRLKDDIEQKAWISLPRMRFPLVLCGTFKWRHSDVNILLETSAPANHHKLQEKRIRRNITWYYPGPGKKCEDKWWECPLSFLWVSIVMWREKIGFSVT